MHYEKGLDAKCSQVSNNAFVNKKTMRVIRYSLSKGVVKLFSIFRINFYPLFFFLSSFLGRS